MNQPYFCRKISNVDLHINSLTRNKSLEREKSRLDGNVLILVSHTVVWKKKLNNKLDHKHIFLTLTTPISTIIPSPLLNVLMNNL